MTPTHYVKKGNGYWDITVFPIGGAFRRAAENLPFVTEGSMFQAPGRGPHAVGRTEDGRRIAVDEKGFAPLEALEEAR